MKNWPTFAITFLIVALDQASKAVVRATIPLDQAIPEDGFVRLAHRFNTGAAFSLFPNQTLLLAGVALVALALVVYYSRHIPQNGFIVQVGLGLQLGGSIGNLIDRLLRGGVTDFLDLGFWPVFNVADASIFTGIGLLTYFVLFYTSKQPEPDQPRVKE